MNQEQVKSAVRWVLATFGGVIGGFFIGKGWVTADQVASVLSNDTVIALITSGVVALVGLIWGQVIHTEAAAVATVDAIPAVAGVVTKPTPEGRALAATTPSETVATAGTPAAKEIAKS